jgi:hypothetical protein
MKIQIKARIAIGLITVAVLGGTFAVKAYRVNNFLYVPTTPGGQCTFRSFGITAIGTAIPVIRRATLVPGITCVEINVFPGT